MLGRNIEASFTFKSKVNLMPRHFLVRRMSKPSAGTPPRNCTSIRSTFHDEGSRLRGDSSDFDNSIWNRAVELVSASFYERGARVTY